MIYHFCNESFGVPFEAASASFARSSGVPVTIVHQERGASSRARLRRSFAAVARRITNPRLRCIYVRDVNSEEFRSRIGPHDIGIVTGFGQIFRQATIERFRRLVNVHPSILPYYRGPVPTHWCIERGERQSGFTLHHITPKIDDGPILYQEIVAIDEGDTAQTLSMKIGERAVPVFLRYLESAAHDADWANVAIDAGTVYRNPLGYRSHS